MKSIVLILVTLTALHAQRGPVPGRGGTPPPQPVQWRPEDLATISGKVINSITGEPIRNAAIQMGGRGSMANPMPMTFTSTTDGSGAFSMKELPPTQYSLTIQKAMFEPYRPTPASPPFVLAPGQRMTGLEFKMIPLAVVTGRITDEFGDGVVNAQVLAMKWVYNASGTRQLSPRGGNTMTNDIGEYRLHSLPAGKYYIGVTPRSAAVSMQNSVDKSDQPVTNEAYTQTFYPGTVDARSATQVEVAAGAVLQGINIRPGKSATVQVSGKVLNAPSEPSVSVSLRTSDGQISFSARASNGEFMLKKVPPGEYILMASGINPAIQSRLSASQALTVGTSNIENIVLTLGVPFELKGIIRTEGTAPANRPFNISMVRPTLVPTTPSIGAYPQPKVNPDGSFVMQNMMGAEYIASHQGAGLAYLKSARLGNQDIMETPRQITGPEAELVFVYGLNPGTVNGVVTNESGNPIQGATVVLVPDSASRRDSPQAYRPAQAFQQGRYTLSALAPGKYKIFAWEKIEANAWMDPEVLRAAESKAKTVVISEGSSEIIDLKALPPVE
jgi:hypothetical protein